MNKTECYSRGFNNGIKYAKSHAKNKKDYDDTVIFHVANYCDFCYTIGFKEGYFVTYDKYYKKYIDSSYKPTFSWGDEYSKSKNMFKGLSHSQYCEIILKQYNEDYQNDVWDAWNESGYNDY